MARYILIAFVFCLPILANASDSGSQIAWTTETLNLVKSGNAKKGEEIAGTCIACHGQRGEGTNSEIRDDETIPAIPALAGQLATYTYKQLRDYANGDRDNSTMTAIAKGLSEQDTVDVAAWYASLSRPKHPVSNVDVSGAMKLVKDGDGKRILPPCFVCHGANGEGEKLDIPRLARQRSEYFESTLKAYKNDERHNDIYSRMRLIAKQLTDDEIKIMSIYYQELD